MSKDMFRIPRRLWPLALIVAVCVTPLCVAGVAGSSPQPHKVQLAAFRSRFGGSRFGGGGLFSRHRSYTSPYRGRYYSRPSLFHRIVRALAFAYILHLLFTNGVFSLVLWVVIIAILSRLFRWRARRYSY